MENHVSEGIPDDWSVWEVLEAVELVAATEGFFKLAVEPLDEPPIRKDEPKNKHKWFIICKGGTIILGSWKKEPRIKINDSKIFGLR